MKTTNLERVCSVGNIGGGLCGDKHLWKIDRIGISVTDLITLNGANAHTQHDPIAYILDNPVFDAQAGTGSIFEKQIGALSAFCQSPVE